MSECLWTLAEKRRCLSVLKSKEDERPLSEHLGARLAGASADKNESPSLGEGDPSSPRADESGDKLSSCASGPSRSVFWPPRWARSLQGNVSDP